THDRSHFFWTAHASHRNGVDDLFERHVFDHLRLDQARRDAIYRDVPPRQFHRKRLGRADYSGLRRAVIDLAAIARDPRDRRQRNDTARTPRPDHWHDDGVQHVIETAQVGVHHAIP